MGRKIKKPTEHEEILEQFLLKTKDRDDIVNYFLDSSETAKVGFLKMFYRTGLSIIHGHYVEFDLNGVMIYRNDMTKYTWQQVAKKIDTMIKDGKYGPIKAKPKEETEYQMVIFDYPEVLP